MTWKAHINNPWSHFQEDYPFVGKYRLPNGWYSKRAKYAAYCWEVYTSTYPNFPVILLHLPRSRESGISPKEWKEGQVKAAWRRWEE